MAAPRCGIESAVSWAETEGQHVDPVQYVGWQWQIGTAWVHDRPDRSLRKGAEPRIAHAADVVAGDLGFVRHAAGVGGYRQQHAFVVDVQRSGILGPALPHMVADGATLVDAQCRGVIPQRVATAVWLAAGPGIGAKL